MAEEESQPWNTEIAAASLARWDAVCAREGWGEVPRNRELLRMLFGASWYLTRFLFYSGRETAALLDREGALPGAEAIREALALTVEGGMDGLEPLRVARNRLLLTVTLADLQGLLSQERLEEYLSLLARGVLQNLLRRQGLADLVVLGMGRLGVGEMNYGSDLDLILLYPRHGKDPLHAITMLLRHCQTVGPAGKLYDIDVRLRPHGQAGTLVSSLEHFRGYHRKSRATWERQVMTRCHPVQDPRNLGSLLLQDLAPGVYAPPDRGRLRREIVALRGRVERELGNPRGFRELKRGRGGIMDLDFLAHYLQLLHGRVHPALQGAGTRQSLRMALCLGLLDPCHASLVDCYDFLKRVEGRLRLFEMRTVSRFAPASAAFLARACGMGAGHDPSGAFLSRYEHTTETVRAAFRAVLGEPGQSA